MKCDEGRPVCKRCISSGRVCEGYGIWGGGNANIGGSSLSDAATAGLLLPKTTVGASAEERDLLEWFRFRTTVKFQSAFGSKFWEVLALRASLEEPAIFHAVIAISAVHKRIILGDGEVSLKPDSRDALLMTYQRQRSKAVSKLLEPHTSGLTTAAIRTALIACMIFTNMDFAIGHYESGARHFHSGIKLLCSLQAGLTANPASPGCIPDNKNGNQEDMWIIEAFSRGNLCTAQFGMCYWMPEPVPDNFCTPLPSEFDSMEHAKKTLDLILSDTIKVTGQALGRQIFTDLNANELEQWLQKMRQTLKASVDRWARLFERALPAFETTLFGRQSRLGLCILRMMHSMTTIMADVCLSADDVMAYDAHTHNFYNIIVAGQDLLHAIREVHRDGNDALKPYRELFTFVPEAGWQSPLFFTALHCRARRLRLHAIKYLFGVPVQEFIWNHKIAASIGREIMDIEHGIDPVSDADDFDVMNIPPLEDIVDPDLPASQRVTYIQVALYDHPQRAVMTYARQDAFGGREIMMREYALSNVMDAFRPDLQTSGTKQTPLGENALVRADTEGHCM